jgi:hypothetical protein
MELENNSPGVNKSDLTRTHPTTNQAEDAPAGVDS